MCRVTTLEKHIDRVFVIFPIIAILATMTLTVITAVFFFSGKTPNIDEQTTILEAIRLNINGAAINDIKSVVMTSGCEPGYQQITLYRFPGTKPGCNCGTTLYQGTCSSSISGCSTVDALPAQDIRAWSQNLFCAKNITSYVKLSNPQTESCPPTYRACSRVVCVRQEEACPLTDLQIVPSSSPTPTDGITTDIALHQGDSKLRLIRKQYDPFIVNLQVTLNERPCLNPTKKPELTNNAAHLLWNGNEAGCSPYGVDQTNTVLIANKGFANYLMEQNQGLNPDKVYQFERFAAIQTALFTYKKQYYVREISECQNINFSNVSSLKSIIEDINTFMFIMLIIELSFYGISLLIILIYIARAISSREIGVGHYGGIINFFAWPIMILLIIKGAVVFSDRATFNALGRDYNSIKANNCFSDPNIIKVIDDTVNSIPDYVLYSIYLSYALLIVASCCLFILILLYIFKFFIFRYRKERVDYNDTNYYYEMRQQNPGARSRFGALDAKRNST